MYLNFKTTVQVPFNQLSQLGNITDKLQPTFGTFLYKKNGEETKIGEKIKYWIYPIDEMIQLDMDRLLQSQMDTDSQPCYGYKLTHFFGEEDGVFVIIEADHGGGKSCYLVRINVLSSKARRDNANKVDYGTRTLEFAQVDCRKDVVEVQKKIAPAINFGKRKIESSKLIAVSNDEGKVKCIFIPKSAENLRTSDADDVVGLTYVADNKQTIISTEIPSTNTSNLWTVINNIKMVVAGDLSFFATSTGRDGRSHCRCTYCDLTPKEWSDSTCNATKSNMLDLRRLYSYADLYNSSSTRSSRRSTDTKGVIMEPLLQFEPFDYISPILHLMIGIVNKIWISLIDFLDEFVEHVSLEESEMKGKLEFCQLMIEEITDEIKIHTVNKNQAMLECQTDLEAKDIIEESKKILDQLEIERKSNTQKVRTLKKSLEEVKTSRSGNEESISNLMYGILDDFNIKRQHFHGGL